MSAIGYMLVSDMLTTCMSAVYVGQRYDDNTYVCCMLVSDMLTTRMSAVCWLAVSWQHVCLLFAGPRYVGNKYVCCLLVNGKLATSICLLHVGQR